MKRLSNQENHEWDGFVEVEAINECLLGHRNSKGTIIFGTRSIQQAKKTAWNVLARLVNGNC